MEVRHGGVFVEVEVSKWIGGCSCPRCSTFFPRANGDGDVLGHLAKKRIDAILELSSSSDCDKGVLVSTSTRILKRLPLRFFCIYHYVGT